jgi:hypothetical protein
MLDKWGNSPDILSPRQTTRSYPQQSFCTRLVSNSSGEIADVNDTLTVQSASDDVGTDLIRSGVSHDNTDVMNSHFVNPQCSIPEPFVTIGISCLVPVWPRSSVPKLPARITFIQRSVLHKLPGVSLSQEADFTSVTINRESTCTYRCCG